MNLMLYGNSCSGKTTFMKILAKSNYTAIPTGDLTRQLYSFGCKNMPVIVQNIIANLSKDREYVFDHFYIHTCEQLHDLFSEWPTVIHVIDRRTEPTFHSQDPDKIKRKQARFNWQADEIERWLKDNDVPVVIVYNTDYGFDVSELIEHGILDYNTRVMLKP